MTPTGSVGRNMKSFCFVWSVLFAVAVLIPTPLGLRLRNMMARKSPLTADKIPCSPLTELVEKGDRALHAPRGYGKEKIAAVCAEIASDLFQLHNATESALDRCLHDGEYLKAKQGYDKLRQDCQHLPELPQVPDHVLSIESKSAAAPMNNLSFWLVAISCFNALLSIFA